jgi:hypothetical protein
MILFSIVATGQQTEKVGWSLSDGLEVSYILEPVVHLCSICAKK